MGGYPQLLGITWDEFIGMGRNNPDDHSERFCMSVFACNTCQEVNGVSKLHGWVSQKMFNNIWNGYYPRLHEGSSRYDGSGYSIILFDEKILHNTDFIDYIWMSSLSPRSGERGGILLF